MKKNIEKSEVRTVLTYEEKKQPVPERVEDPMQIEKILITNLSANPDFFPSAELPGIYPNQLQESGFLHKSFTLFSMLRWTGLTEADQDKIWSVLDKLAAERRIKILNMSISPHHSHLNILFNVQIGKAVRESTICGLKIVEKDYYWEKPLSEEEYFRKDRIIEVPSECAKNLRDRMYKSFDEKFGKRDFDLDEKLRREEREEREAEARLKAAIMKIADKIDRL